MNKSIPDVPRQEIYRDEAVGLKKKVTNIL